MADSWHTRKSLILRASNPDDHNAFEEFAYYYKKFIQMVLRKLGVKAEQCKDLEQELLLKLWKDLIKFDVNHNLKVI